jgi:hypothetical protein
MSALGQKRTSRPEISMQLGCSLFPQKRTLIVCYCTMPWVISASGPG